MNTLKIYGNAKRHLDFEIINDIINRLGLTNPYVTHSDNYICDVTYDELDLESLKQTFSSFKFWTHYDSFVGVKLENYIPVVDRDKQIEIVEYYLDIVQTEFQRLKEIDTPSQNSTDKEMVYQYLIKMAKDTGYTSPLTSLETDGVTAILDELYGVIRTYSSKRKGK